MKQTDALCIADDCERPGYSRRMCLMHYKRWRKYGDPNLLKIASRLMTPEQKLRFHGWTVTEAGCWEWNGGRQWNGYGIVSIGSRDLVASRVSFELWVRPLAEGEIACHRCDNPPCMNPDHLFAGSYKDNAQDSSQKGRAAGLRTWGETKHNAILTNVEVAEIRRLLPTFVGRQKELAWRYGVSIGHISSIKHGRSRVRELQHEQADAA